jgi:hypothetical protein
MHHPKLGAIQLLFLRTLRHALLQHAEIATIESLRQPPFGLDHHRGEKVRRMRSQAILA